jgi:hypothetical protein
MKGEIEEEEEGEEEEGRIINIIPILATQGTATQLCPRLISSPLTHLLPTPE